ncbi:hypothetical protein [Crocosphaera sp.]|uniref:hypothetical protein n=1 Tax=Crocosphaera sp. TaxID=2729996 RepID=UPI003F1EF406|nr:hypothetical protein [Crocosphaera sp.]
MNNLELQQQINKELSKISPENLKIIAEFVQFIKDKQEVNLSQPTNYRPASGRSILRHGDTWKGDDLEQCLQLMYETRGKVIINNHINPFE